MQMAARRKARGKKNAAVAQTTDIVASHTGDKWTEDAGGLYPYLKTKRGKVNQGQDNIHSSVELPAPAGNTSSGVEMTHAPVTHGHTPVTNGHASDNVSPDQADGVTLV